MSELRVARRITREVRIDCHDDQCLDSSHTTVIERVEWEVTEEQAFTQRDVDRAYERGRQDLAREAIAVTDAVKAQSKTKRPTHWPK